MNRLLPGAILAGLFVAAALPADAQAGFRYERESRNRRLVITYGGGYYRVTGYAPCAAYGPYGYRTVGYGGYAPAYDAVPRMGFSAPAPPAQPLRRPAAPEAVVALGSDPTIHAAARLMREAKSADAVRLLRRAVIERPDDARTLAAFAAALAAEGDYRNADKSLRSAVDRGLDGAALKKLMADLPFRLDPERPLKSDGAARCLTLAARLAATGQRAVAEAILNRAGEDRAAAVVKEMMR